MAAAGAGLPATISRAPLDVMVAPPLCVTGFSRAGPRPIRKGLPRSPQALPRFGRQGIDVRGDAEED